MTPKTITPSSYTNAEAELTLDEAGQPLLARQTDIWEPAPFAVFQFADGRNLEIHIPGALQVAIAGPSNATDPSFLWVNPDLSIEDSGALIFMTRVNARFLGAGQTNE